MRDLRDLPEVISTTTITVYGAGAIGGVTGAALAEAGHDVLLVDRAVDHVTAMNAHGLTVDRRTGSSTTRVRAITPDVLGSGLELLLLAVKSQDTPAALEVLAPRLATDGAILVATAVVDAHVYEVVERSHDVQAMLVRLVIESMDVAEAAGIKLQLFDEYDPADYRAAAGGDVAARQRAMAIIATHYRAHTKTKTGIWRDLAVRRRKTEVGALLGATVAKAGPLGIAMPLTERLIAMIEDLETGRRVMGWANVDELVSVR